MRYSSKLVKYKKDNPIKYIIIVSLPAIISFLFSFLALRGENNEFLQIALSILIALSVEFFILNAERIFTELHIAEEFEQVKNIALENQIFITLKGAVQIIDHIEQKIENAEYVRNTFIGQSEFFYKDEKIVNKIVNLYNTWINSPVACQWEDIIGRPEFFADRYKKISSNKPNATRPNINVHVVFGHLPFSNFMILSTPEDGECIYIGWSQAKVPSKDTVIYTRSPKVIEMYKNLFDELKQSRNCWNGVSRIRNDGYRLKTVSKEGDASSCFEGNIIAEKVGIWTTIGIDRSNDKVVDFAMLNVDYVDGQAVAHVKVFSLDGELKRAEERYHDREFGHHMNRLIFEFPHSKTNEIFLMHFVKASGAPREHTLLRGFISTQSAPYRVDFRGFRSDRLPGAMEMKFFDGSTTERPSKDEMKSYFESALKFARELFPNDIPSETAKHDGGNPEAQKGDSAPQHSDR
tara:strand:+ start:836 stop:2227 length:1392 start_codon:yes stop_codon:yes gene_type:complete